MALSEAIAKAFDKAGGGSGRIAALPDNTVVRGVITPKKDTVYIDKGNLANSGPNAQTPIWNMRFVVPAGLEYAGRNFFARIPRSYFMAGKSGGRVESYATFGLLKALGYTAEKLQDDTPQKLTDRELLGKPVDLVLGVEDDPAWDKFLDGVDLAERREWEQKAAQNPLLSKRNRVKFINAPKATTGNGSAGAVPPGGPSGTPSYAAPAPTEDPWANQAPVADAAAGEADPWSNFDAATSTL